MTYLIDVPVEGGGRLLVQAATSDLPGDLELAGARPGEIVARASRSLEQALDQLQPIVRAVHDRVAALSPTETTVEFGVVLGAESGVIIAKGTAEVHFTITLTWNGSRSAGQRPGHG